MVGFAESQNGPLAVCRTCHRQFNASLLNMGNAVGMTFVDCGTICPYCGGDANIVNGTYDFVGGIVAAFSDPGVSRETIAEFGRIAKSVNEGKLSAAEAASLVEKFNDSIVAIWNWANTNSGGLSLLAIVVSIILALPSFFSTDSDNLLKESQTQTAISQRNLEVQQKIYAELEKQRAEAVKQPPNLSTTTVSRRQTPSLGSHANRHERRKAARVSKRSS